MLHTSLFVTRVNVLGSVVKLTVVTLRLFKRLVSVHAALDEVHHFAEADELIADDLIVLVEGDACAVALGHLQITGTLFLGGEHCADL